MPRDDATGAAPPPAAPRRRPPVPRHAPPAPIARSVIAQLARDFEAHGAGVIKTLRAKNPATYMRLVAALVPNDVPPPALFRGFTHEELSTAARLLRDHVAPRRPGRRRAGAAKAPEKGGA